MKKIMSDVRKIIFWTIFMGLVFYSGFSFIITENLEIKVNDLQKENFQVKQTLEKYQNRTYYTEKDEFIMFAFQKKNRSFCDIASIIYDESKRHNVSPYVILSIAWIESNFNPKAVSNANAYGLMQVHYPTWKEKFKLTNPKQLFDPFLNIKFGIYIYQYYKKLENGNIEKALHRYCNGYIVNPKSPYSSKVMGSSFMR